MLDCVRLMCENIYITIEFAIHTLISETFDENIIIKKKKQVTGRPNNFVLLI